MSESHAPSSATDSPPLDSLRPSREGCPGNCRLEFNRLQARLQDAARHSQCLLARHEAYVAEAELEKKRMATTIASLEASNTNLEEDNSRIITENQGLLGRVECLNTSISTSDAQIRSLSSALSSAQMEIHTLQFLTQRAQTLEQQLATVEAEQTALHEQLILTRDEERAAKSKWRDGQRQIGDLMDQLENIEREANEERVRHDEAMQQLKLRSTLPRDASPKRENAAVGNFVKQILQDNANLQMTMVDLQELLAHSKNEMDAMRDQLNDVQLSVESSRPNLSQELDQHEDSNKEAKALHVHHHYHPARQQPHRRASIQQRQRSLKKITTLSGRSTPFNDADSVYYGAVHSRQGSTASASSNIPIMPAQHARKRSIQAAHNQNIFSGPASPGSTYTPSTVFERAFDDTTDYSRPTSPESNGLISPTFGPVHRKDYSQDSIFVPLSLPTRVSAFPQEMEVEERKNKTPTDEQTAAADSHPRRMSPIPSEPDVPETASPRIQRTKLHRAASRTSLYSISGMDIHSTFPDPNDHSSPHRPPPFVLRSRPSIIHADSSTDVLLTHANAHSYGPPSAENRLGSWKTLRSTLEAVPENAGPGAGSSKDRYVLADTFGRRVGGWFGARWADPRPLAQPLPASRPKGDAASVLSAASTQSQTSVGAPRREDLSQLRSVSAGDAGAVMTAPLDSDALRECLDEGGGEVAAVPTAS